MFFNVIFVSDCQFTPVELYRTDLIIFFLTFAKNNTRLFGQSALCHVTLTDCYNKQSTQHVVAGWKGLFCLIIDNCSICLQQCCHTIHQMPQSSSVYSSWFCVAHTEGNQPDTQLTL